MERTASLKQGLVDTSTTRNDTDRCSAAAGYGLLRATGQTDAGLVLIGRVANDSRVVAGRPCKRTAVARLLLYVADNGTLRALRNREDVADSERGLLAAVDERAGVEALRRDEGLLAELVAVRVAEDDTSERSTTACRVRLEYSGP